MIIRRCTVVLSMLYALCAMPLCALASTNSIARTFRWYVETDQNESYTIPAWRRGENVNLTPTYRSYLSPHSLEGVHLVTFRYQPSAWALGTPYNVITGSVVSAEEGTILIPWDSSREFTNNTYRYEIAVQSTTEMMVSSAGSFSLLSSMADNGATNTSPQILSVIDMLTVEIRNIGAAPWLSTFQIDDLQAQLTSLFDGTGDAHVHSITSDIPYYGSAANLSGFPGYLARSNQVPENAVTNVAAGAAEAGGSIDRTDPHNIVVHFPIVSEGEVATTNRLYWIVEGQAIGYVNSNGITMLKGSLQLYEEDLNCNVRAYDGAKQAPSVTFYSSPLSGWYRKSVSGEGAWAYAHNSNDVGYINNYGWLLLGTRTYTGYGAELGYCNVTAGYQVNGTNGGTTNINVIVSGGATQTLHFVGGILLP